MKPDMATVKCKRCGEMGHFTSQYPSKKKNEAQRVMHVKWSDKEDDSDDNDLHQNFFIGTIHYQYTISGGTTFTRMIFDKDSSEDD